MHENPGNEHAPDYEAPQQTGIETDDERHAAAEESPFTAPIPGDGINENLERDPDYVEGKVLLDLPPRIL
jgi:hypothetical protein